MAATDMRVEARHYRREGGRYICGLCPHGCRIRPGEYGRCGSRRGDEDMLVAYSYGKVSSLCVDPVEKKPLYHWKPRSKCFSVGGIGCNMRCRHCQNYSISMLSSGKKRTTFEKPEELVELCRRESMTTMAFTYNEPMIWHEYILDIMAVGPELECILVTNGLVSEEPLREICKVTDAMNVDVKGFTDGFYMDVCGAHLGDVLNSLRIIHEEKVHLELTYLVIPGYNDSDDEIREFCRWVVDNLTPDVPIHFTRFHPDNKMLDVPWTPVETVLRCRSIGLDEGLLYVYVGNTLDEVAGSTYCPDCGARAVDRLGYLVDISGLDGTQCAKCGRDLNIIR